MSFRKMLAPLAVLAALFGVAACSDGYDSPVGPINPAPAVKTIYTASTSLSDYTQRVVKSLGHAKAAASAVPDLFVINGSDLAALTGDSLKKFFETSLKGGTVLVDAPTSAQVTAFKSNADALFASDSVLKGRVEQGANTFYEVVKQFEKAAADTGASSPLSGDKILAYEAVSVRGKQIYYVHDIDASLHRDDAEKTAKRARNAGERECAENVVTNTPPLNPDNDWESAKKSSVANFSSWLNGSGASLLSSRPAAASATQGLKADPMVAQSFVHNFSALFNHGTDPKYHYDGRYNGKVENVEVIVDVWAACQIDKPADATGNVDHYLVRTSVVCNNQQLGCKNDWDSAKHVGPYFESCNIVSQMENAKIKTNEISPQNAAGSSSFTTGSGFSIGGNVGFCPTGPTGGVSVGYSESQSSTRSIPDITAKFNGTDGDSKISWDYTTPDVEPYWSWFSTHCDGPKNIQTVAAIFDTYTLYRLPADKSCPDNSDTIRLETAVQVKLACISGWLESVLEVDWYWLYHSTSVSYSDYVKKPSDVFAEYIMSFNPPEGTSAAEADRLHSVVKEYISDWNSVERYYGVAKGNMTASLDEVAKNYFASVKKKISDNKDVFKGRGFKGTFTFYVNRVDGGSRVDYFDLTF